MNLHEVNSADWADILLRSRVLDTWTADGFIVSVVEYAGNDAIVIANASGESAIVIECNDANYGGSIHDHLRGASRAGTI